jgi:hypothetical protein
MLSSPWPEPVREAENVDLMAGVEHLDDGELYRLVRERRDAEGPLPSIRLWDARPTDRLVNDHSKAPNF